MTASALLIGPERVDAADHRDAPGTQADPFADLNDVYAWHTEAGSLVVVLTFNPLLLPDADPTTAIYNPDELPGVLYTIHIDNDSMPLEDPAQWDVQDNATFDSDIQIHVKFGQNGLGDWGVRFENVPGSAGPIVGPVQTVLEDGDVRAIAGVFDDPFFFDLQGFADTLANLDDDTPATETDLAFASLTLSPGMPVDAFAGQNTMAIVVEFEAALAVDGNPDNFIQVWGTSGRVAR